MAGQIKAHIVFANPPLQFFKKWIQIHYHNEPDEEMLAAFFAVYDYAREIHEIEDKPLYVEKGKEIAPWVLNKRLR